MEHHVLPVLYLCACGAQLNTSLEDVAICDCDPAFSASRSCYVVSAMLYRNGIYNCVLVYATLFTWKARRQRQKVLATLLRCAPWQRDSRIYVNCGWDRSRHGSIRSHVFIPRSSPCLRLSASRCIGALCRRIIGIFCGYLKMPKTCMATVQYIYEPLCSARSDPGLQIRVSANILTTTCWKVAFFRCLI